MRLLLLSTALSVSLVSAASVSFEKDVQPIFAAKCIVCHGAAPQGKLDLRTPESTLKGAASGPVIAPGNAAKSLLLDKIVTRQMPPGSVKMTDAEIDIVRQWIDTSLKPVPADVEPVPTERDVLAILQVRCMICHGSLNQKGGLDLRTVASRRKGGKSGAALVPGKPDESPMYARIVSGQMPPPAMAKELAVELPTETEIEKIKRWIVAGAPGPLATPGPTADIVIKDGDKQFWSFQPPVKPAVPQPQHANLVRNPIDAFLLTKLEAKGMSYQPEANRLALLRRVSLDLTGLPPTKAELDTYLMDKAPGAYERQVDRLLAGKHYGERWGQHWLDLAGYADSEGFGQDDGVRPYAWRYRDYVIRSLNADKPYTQFITEQIAGDELSDDWKKAKNTASQELIDRIAATGFLRATPDQTNSEERALIAERMNIVADEVEVLASSVMGLTVGCARCHNHKYDPIPQRDYYRLSAVLQAAYNPYEWKTPKQREIPLSVADERQAVDANNAPIEADLMRIQDDIQKLVDSHRKPEDNQATARDLDKKYPELAQALKPLREEQGKLRGRLLPKPHVRILTDNEQPSISFLLRRGDPVGFGDPVDPGVPTVLENAALKPYKPESPFPGASGRRLALAQWLTQPNHPLTARVAVNQIWSRHFGRGIVATVANFGRSGSPPSNQELLDWLATDFAQTWSMKRLHRLIVTSQAYRQSSTVDGKTLAADPENALISRMPLQRMDAETLYDALLTTTGRLDPTAFGKPAPIEIRPDKEVVMKPAKEGFRRAIYILHRRQTPLSLMDAFDQPAMTPNCTERRRSNVATQALHMMNGSMTWELARFMAGRVIDDAGEDRAKQIEQVYLRAYARPPSAEELALGKQAIEQFAKGWPARLATDSSDAPRTSQAQWLALANYCHAILNSAEFSFID